jgi:hypothetical protein
MNGEEAMPQQNTYKVYYAKQPTFMENPDLTLDNLVETHVFLIEIEAESLEGVYRSMQAEVWSPGGQANDLVRAKGLHHTSMSIGDVIEAPDGKFHEVAWIGFNEIVRGIGP